MFAPSTVLSAIVGLTLFGGPATAIAVPSADDLANPALQARVWRSNINMLDACREQYGSTAVDRTVGGGCNDFKCAVGTNLAPVDVNAYCQKRFGSEAYAKCDKSVYDWQCHDRT